MADDQPSAVPSQQPDPAQVPQTPPAVGAPADGGIVPPPAGPGPDPVVPPPIPPPPPVPPQVPTAPPPTPPAVPSSLPAATPAPTTTPAAPSGAFTPEELVEKDLFTLMGLSELPEKDREEILTKMLELVRDRVLLRVSDDLPEAARAELNTLLEQDGNDDAIQALMQRNNIDMQRYTMEESLAVKAEFAKSADAARAST